MPTRNRTVTRRVRFVLYLPCIILIVVGLNQLFLAGTANLSPWKGGGFGMFSTTDGGPNRHLHIFLIGPGIEKEVWSPPSLGDMEKRVCALPSQARLRKFANRIAGHFPNEVDRLFAVRVEVWHTHFDLQDLKPMARILREFVVNVDNELH